MISVGARSLLSIIKSKDIPGKEYDTHSLKWYEMDEDKNPTYKPVSTKLKY